MNAMSNCGEVDLPKRRITLDQDMAAFDRLPDRVRFYLRQMSVRWDAIGVWEIFQKHGEDITMKVLERADLDMFEAYRVKVGLQ